MLTEKNKDQNKILLRITGGNLERKGGNGEKYGSVSGKIHRIYLREAQNADGKFHNWHLEMADETSGEKYDISASRSSVAFKNIIRCLATSEGLKSLENIEIKVYPSQNGYSNTSIYSNGKRIRWDDNDGMPPVKKTGDDRDDSEQIAWLVNAVDKINAAAGGEETTTSDDADWSGFEEDLPEY